MLTSASPQGQAGLGRTISCRMIRNRNMLEAIVRLATDLTPGLAAVWTGLLGRFQPFGHRLQDPGHGLAPRPGLGLGLRRKQEHVPGGGGPGRGRKKREEDLLPGKLAVDLPPG